MQNWNLLDNDLLNWWIDSGEFNKVSHYFHHVRLAIEPQACYLAALHASETQKRVAIISSYRNAATQR